MVHLLYAFSYRPFDCNSFSFAILAVITLFLYGQYRASVPFIRVGKHALESIVAALELTPNARLYDLGSGDGRVLRHLLSLFRR